MSGKLLCLIEEKTKTLKEQQKNPQEALETEMIKPMETFHFDSVLRLKVNN